MSSITQMQPNQYADSERLAARAKLHGFAQAPVPWFTWVAQHVDLPENGSLLDVGCGPAWFWPEASAVLPHCQSLTLLDQSPGMIEEALARCRPLDIAKVEGLVGDATDLPFGEARFDAVIAMHMLYHVADQDRAIREFHRVLRPGGCLVVTTNGLDNMRELYGLTTVFGSTPHDPSATAFGLDRAQGLLEEVFGNADLSLHPGTMRVTDQDIVYLALTSYPPGDTAPPEQRQAFRQAIASAFETGDGGIDVTREVAVLVSRKN